MIRVRVDRMTADRPETSETLGTDRLDADRRGFQYAIDRLDRNTTLRFTLTDADDITGRDPVRLVLVAAPDQPPRMAVQLDGIGVAVTPQARIPVVGRVADDYGVGRVWFEYGIDDREPVGRRIAEFSTAPASCDLDGAALDVGPLGLKPGQKLIVGVRASDLCDLGQGNNLSGSERWLLDVVSPAALRAMLEARELVLRQRFERMLQEVTETRDLLARLEFERATAEGETAASSADVAPDSAPDNVESADSPKRRASLRLLRVQGALNNCRKNAQEVLGAAEAFDDICKQLVNNRVDTEELKRRLDDGIAKPLHRIAGEMFPEWERRIEALQADLEDPRARSRAARSRPAPGRRHPVGHARDARPHARTGKLQRGRGTAARDRRGAQEVKGADPAASQGKTSRPVEGVATHEKPTFDFRRQLWRP